MAGCDAVFHTASLHEGLSVFSPTIHQLSIVSGTVAVGYGCFTQ